MPQRSTVFISYSHRDSRWLKRLQVYLRPYDRSGALTLWDDTKILPGDDWRGSIRTAIDSAAAAVLLVSGDFLASDFIDSDELPPLLARAKKHTKILTLFVGPARLTEYPALARFQALNSPDLPLSMLPKGRADRALSDAAAAIMKIVPPRLEDLFESYRSAIVGLSILVMLATMPDRTGLTLTELTRTLEITSRELAFNVVNQLSNAGWIQKNHASKGLAYRISDEGIRQLKRLSTAASGPVRQSLSLR